MIKLISIAAIISSFSMQAAFAQDGVQLSTIVVDGKEVEQRYTINNLPEAFAGGQVAKGARLGALGNRQWIDTPFNVTSYTANLIENQGAKTVADVVKNDSSVRNTHMPGGMVDSYYIRGFPVHEGNFGEVAFDGVFGVAPSYRVFTEYAERIEVLKGPSALLYGLAPNSSVGGIINVVPKRAVDDFTRVTTSYESDLNGGVHVDWSRRFGNERQFGARINSSLKAGDTSVDHLGDKVSLVSLGLDYEGERLRATFDFIGQREKIKAPFRPFYPISGISIPDAPNGKINVQERWEWSASNDYSALGRMEYDITDQTTAFLAVGGGRSYLTRLFGTPSLLNNDGDLSILPQYGIFDVKRFTSEAGLRSEFETGAIEHTVTLQGNLLKQSFNRALNSGSLQYTNIFNPAVRPFQDIDKPDGAPRIAENTLWGLSLVDTISMFDDKVQLTLGGRWQDIDATNFNATTGAISSSSKENAFTPLAAISYKYSDTLSFYANYAEGLSIGDTAPTTAINAGESLSPYISRQYEVGAKAEFDGLGLGISLFQIEKPFGQLEDTEAGPLFLEGGEQRNRGIELTTFGEVTPELRVLGGVTLLEGKLVKTNSPETQGNKPVGVPTVQVNAGLEWDTPFLSGLTLSASSIYTSKQYVNTANTQSLSDWTVVNLGARYRTEIDGTPVVFRASVDNVFDTDYWSGVASYSTIAVGAPRTFKLSMTTDF